MSLNSKYRTVKKETEGLYKEKGSKFIGLAVPCYNEEEAKVFLEDWKKRHHQARHLCYAYKFGVDGKKFRANDDGEPNNSAGAPILGQIDSFELTNVLIGVVRYYGGTKLGVGGLINAYRTGAKEAIQNGEIVELEVYDWIDLTFGYEDMPHVMNLLKKHNLTLSNNVFEESCQLTTYLDLNKAAGIKAELDKFETVEVIEKGIY
ncbi:MAG: IMPACT family protein [Crocinitomicaceae bacterium]